MKRIALIAASIALTAMPAQAEDLFGSLLGQAQTNVKASAFDAAVQSQAPAASVLTDNLTASQKSQLFDVAVDNAGTVGQVGSALGGNGSLGTGAAILGGAAALGGATGMAQPAQPQYQQQQPIYGQQPVQQQFQPVYGQQPAQQQYQPVYGQQPAGSAYQPTQTYQPAQPASTVYQAQQPITTYGVQPQAVTTFQPQQPTTYQLQQPAPSYQMQQPAAQPVFQQPQPTTNVIQRAASAFQQPGATNQSALGSYTQPAQVNAAQPQQGVSIDPNSGAISVSPSAINALGNLVTGN